MTEYKCDFCNFKTHLRSNFKRHTLTLKHKKKIGNIDPELIDCKKFVIAPSKTLNFPHFSLKNPQKISPILVSFVVRNFQDLII